MADNKNDLIKMVKKLVRHRERMMNEHGARKTLGKLEAVSRILKALDLNKDKSIEVISRNILKLENEFKKIMPGKSSKFYLSDREKLNNILIICIQSIKKI